MGSDWESVSLGDYCTKIGSGATPKGGSSVYQDSGEFCLIRSQNIYNEGFNLSGLVYIDKVAATKLKNVEVEENDILLNITGDSVARVCLAPTSYLPARVNQHVAIIRPNPKEFDARFLRYQLASQKMQQLLLNLASAGATRNALTKGMIETFEVSKPPLSVQAGIADMLESLDNKITLNRQINQTLEQMAQTLFKSWFVDFDPVIDNALDAGNAIPDELQARAEQRQALRHAVNEANKANQPHSTRTNPASGDALASPYQPLPDDIRQLFPNEFEESELGWVPKGWGCVNLTMLVDTISKTYPLKTVEEVIFLNTGDIEDGRFLHSDYSKVSGLPGQAKKSIQRNDILFSEIRPKNKRFAFVNFDSEHHVVSTKLMVLRAKEAVNPLFAYFLLTLEKTTNELQRIAELRSGTFPQITYNELGLISFALPDNSDLIEKFVVSYLQPFYDKSFKALAENEALANLRDTLLPKLISGELRLDEVEFTIAETITATTA